MSDPEAGTRLQELLARLDSTLGELERSGDSEEAVELLNTMAEVAREVQAEVDRLRRDVPDDAPPA